MFKLTPRTLRILKTCNLYLGFAVFGMCYAIPGPTLLDLQHMVGTDSEHIAFVYTGRSIGCLVGSISGGMVFDLVKRKQIILILCTLVESATLLIIPWSRSFEVLTPIMLLKGASMGGFDTCANSYLLNLWGKESAPYFQALHFSFGLGGLISPLIVAPFLTNFNQAQSVIDIISNETRYIIDAEVHSSLNITEQSQSEHSDIPRITYAYSMLGTFALLVLLLFLSIYMISPEDATSAKDATKKCQKRSSWFIVLIVGLNFVMLFIQTGAVIGYAQMLTPYAVKGKLHLLTTTGSYMTSSFWAALTISRCAAVFLAVKFTNLTLILCDVIITFAAALIIVTLSSYTWSLWLSSILFGIGTASFYAAAVGWFNSYITVTNRISGLFVCSAAFGELVIPFVIGFYIDKVPEVFIYMLPVTCISYSFILLVLYLILRRVSSNVETQATPAFTIDVSNASL